MILSSRGNIWKDLMGILRDMGGSINGGTSASMFGNIWEIFGMFQVNFGIRLKTSSLGGHFGACFWDTGEPQMHLKNGIPNGGCHKWGYPKQVYIYIYDYIYIFIYLFIFDYKNTPRILLGSVFIIIYGGVHKWCYPK